MALPVAFGLPILLLLCASSAQAGEITLTTTLASTLSDQGIQVSVQMTNEGNADADDVSMFFQCGAGKAEVKVADRIGPGQTGSAVAKLPPVPGKGTFPLFVKTRYKDSSGQAYSTASLTSVNRPPAPAPALQMTVTRGYDEKWGNVTVDLMNAPEGLRSAVVTCHSPDDLAVKPLRNVVMFKDGAASAAFKLSNVSGNPGSTYQVFFTATYQQAGVNYLAETSESFPIAGPKTMPKLKMNPWHWAVGVALALAFLVATIAIFSRRAREGICLAFEKRWVQIICELLIIAAVEFFILSHISAKYLITDTVTAGGDTASHYYTVDYLRHVLLPEGKISSWTPGNYAGFPILQFYFPLGFLTMCFLNLFIPLTIAFKLVTLFGTFLLPITAWAFLRLIRCPFPGPGLGAAFVLPFLFNTANSMWGGNILSTLAGEFSYSLSIALSLLMLGVLYRGCTENKWVILSAFTVFLVGFSHGYTLLFAEAMSAFLLLAPRNFIQRVVWLAKVYALAFCFLGFWIVPLLMYSKWTIPYHTIWTIDSIWEVLPLVLIPFLIVAAGGIVGLITAVSVSREVRTAAGKPLAFLLFGLFAAGIMYVAAPKLGVLDIRYVPFGQLLACLVAAFAIGWLGRSLASWGMAWAVLLVGVLAAAAWCSDKVDPVPGWTKWNYEGFEAKPDYGLFRNINDSLKGSFQDPRVVYEHSSKHDMFGSTRAFESLPLFAGRATLEGLYMQASVSAPFIFYIQSLVSQERSEPFPQYSYSTLNYERARKRLEMFNVGEMILVSTDAKQAARATAGYRPMLTFDKGYETWRVATNPGHYVVPLENEPVFFRAENWKFTSYQWFTDDQLLDRHLIFVTNPTPEVMKPCKASADSLDDLPRVPIDTKGCQITETIGDEDIDIKTNWIGKPLLIKMSYHPNWIVEGADRIYLASPSFMIVYPNQEHVHLHYGRRGPAKAGMVLTGLGLLMVLINLPVLGRRRSMWTITAQRLNLPVDLVPRFKWDPSARARWTMVIILGGLGAVLLSCAAAWIYWNESNRVFHRGIVLKDKKQYVAARACFEQVLAGARYSDLGRQAAYYSAITYYLQEDDKNAIGALNRLRKYYPHSPVTAEAEYHLGMCYLRSGDEQAGLQQMQRLRREYPDTPWAGYAADRLKEHGVKVP